LKLKIHTQILIAIVLGVAAGVLLGEKTVYNQTKLYEHRREQTKE
jgi:Na+/H+-dicarboxylate symporter